MAFGLLATGHGALAQPSGGAQIQQIPPAPAQPKSLPDIRINRDRSNPAPEPPGVKLVVRTLHIAGETRFTEAELIAASGFQPGAELDLAGLRTLATRISDFYNRHGYFLAQAYVPAQEIKDGAVTITVLEGRYGKISLNNQTNVSTGLANSILAGLNPGEVVATAPLERRLLLLSDLPGVVVKSTLGPGQEVGASDLAVDITPGSRVTGSLEADNAGNPYTGEYRGGGTINFNEPTGQGDVASLRLLTAGSGLTYVRGVYEAHIQAASVGAAYTHLTYRLGRDFAPLDATGTADVASVFGSYPLIRSRDNNLYGALQFDYRSFTDRVGATGTSSDRRDPVVIVGLTGDSHDAVLGGGWTTYSVNLAFGDLDIRTPVIRAGDAATARTNGSYNKLSFDLARLQTLTGPLSLYGEVRGQLASKNLDSSEKMELGGAYGVRAYPEGEAYGDQGYIATVEARLKLSALSQATGGQFQASLFVDQGSVTLNKSPWIGGPNRRTLSAAGVGLTWADSHDLVIKVSYAFRLGNERATSAPDRSGRVWIQLSKFFR